MCKISGRVWLPKPRIYSGENEYSLRPHKPNSVGATPTSATKLPRHEVISADSAESLLLVGRSLAAVRSVVSQG